MLTPPVAEGRRGRDLAHRIGAAHDSIDVSHLFPHTTRVQTRL